MEDRAEELEKNRQLARMQRETAITSKKMATDEIFHASRWIMASVLAINTGGLIACLGKIGYLSGAMLAAIAAFYVGLALAMIAGWSLIGVSQRSLPFHSRLISVWEETVIEGDLSNPDINKASEEFVAFAQKESGLPSTFNKLSFAAFSIGLILFGISVEASIQKTPTAQVSNHHDR